MSEIPMPGETREALARLRRVLDDAHHDLNLLEHWLGRQTRALQDREDTIASLKHGDICRAKCSAPARYLHDGLCAYISAMCNELCIDEARPATGGEEKLPLPDDDQLKAVAAGLRFIRRHRS